MGRPLTSSAATATKTRQAWNRSSGPSAIDRTAEVADSSTRAFHARSTFVRTIAFYARVALPLARRELARWRRRTQSIGDPALRELAIAKLDDDHLHPEGAAVFAMLQPSAARRLIPLLVAYQTLWDLVDVFLEHPALAPADRETVHAAIERALSAEPRGRRTRVSQAGHYESLLDELVDACCSGCSVLPRYPEARPALLRLAARGDLQLITNGAPEGREDAARMWAARHSAEAPELEWAELCAAAQSPLGYHALLATAAKPHRRPDDFEAIEATYFPWVCGLDILLDHLVDQEDDARTESFNFVAQYSSPSHATQRLRMIAERAFEATRSLPDADKHTVLLCAMVGMYLANPAARTPQIQLVADSPLSVTAPVSRWARSVIEWRERVLPRPRQRTRA